jgi:hypothetical protein
LLKALKKIDVQGIVDAVVPFLNPKTIKGLLGLVGNAEDLLTKNFVNQVSELIGDATPVSQPSRFYYETMLTSVSSLLRR